MALSVLASPSGHAVFTPEYFTIQESSGGIYTDTNFKFIAVVKDGSGNELAKFRFPIYPGQTNKGVISVHRILEAQVSNFFDLVSTGVSVSTAPVVNYEVEFGKEYGSPVTEYLNETNVTPTAYNAACDIDVDLIEEWLINTLRRNIHRSELSWLYFNWSDNVPTAQHVVRFISYNAAGGVLGTVEIDFTPTADNQHKVPVGSNTTLVPSGSLYSGSLPLIHPAATYYTVQVFGDVTGSEYPVTSLIRFDLLDTCSQYDGYTFCWLNDRGGFDSWYFNMKREDSYDIERRSIKTNTFEFDGDRYERNEHKHSKKNYFTKSVQKATIHSDNLTTSDAAFIKGLFTSPEVYLLDGSDYYPVNVIADTYEQKKNVNDNVFNVKVDIEYSEPQTLQRL